MNTILDFLGTDHRACDDRFAASEAAVAQNRWENVCDLFGRFHAAMDRHFVMEERILFPAFEAETGFSMGPTRIMRMEHDQMRELLNEMETAIAQRDDTEYLGLSETLNMLMQQHNRKEETMLYPMSDQALAERRDRLIREMEALA
ncbi:MAG: hemerythrin domain-containing protein [Thiobacillaceae bacterium]